MSGHDSVGPSDASYRFREFNGAEAAEFGYTPAAMYLLKPPLLRCYPVTRSTTTVRSPSNTARFWALMEMTRSDSPNGQLFLFLSVKRPKTSCVPSVNVVHGGDHIRGSCPSFHQVFV